MAGVTGMNNYDDQSTNEPVECPDCFSAMTEHAKNLVCDNLNCKYEILKGESNE